MPDESLCRSRDRQGRIACATRGKTLTSTDVHAELDPRQKIVLGSGFLIEKPHRHREHARDELPDDRIAQTLFVPEVMVEHVDARLGMRTDLTYRGAVEALFGDQMRAGAEQPIHGGRLRGFTHRRYCAGCSERCVPLRQLQADEIRIVFLDGVMSIADVDGLQIHQVLLTPRDILFPDDPVRAGLEEDLGQLGAPQPIAKTSYRCSCEPCPT